MILNIAVSKKMSEIATKDVHESKLIRFPEQLRKSEGIELYTFLNLPTKTGEIISLIADKAYKEDALADPTKAYLTQETFQLLAGERLLDVEPCHDVTLGCDPELVIVHRETGAILDAHKIFRKWNQVGSDGLLLELRPAPSVAEETVVNNLFIHLVSARRTLNEGMMISGRKFNGRDYVILARSHYRQPGFGPQFGQNIGFHIHFGLPQKIMAYRQPYILRNIASLLDYYVAVPAILIEGDVDNFRRSQVHVAYGKPGDWRRGAGNITMEYRVPGGALMKSPEAARGILAIAKLTMKDILYRLSLLSNGFEDEEALSDYELVRSLYRGIPSGKEIFSIVCCPSIGPAKAAMKYIYSDYEKMTSFASEKAVIDSFLKIAMNPEALSESVERNWRYFYEQKQQRQVGVR